MSKQNVPLYTFNRGEIGRHALGRVDSNQLRLAAEEQVNFLPMTVGPMQFRPGLKHLGSIADDNVAVIRPFVFGEDDSAVLEFTEELLRVWVDGELITAESVSTTVTNGDFSSSTGWTLTQDDGAGASIGGGILILHSIGIGSEASCEREVTVANADQHVEHRLRIIVTRGPVTFQIGASSEGTQYLEKTALGTGTHSIAFTPTTGSFFVRFSSSADPVNHAVDSIQVESAGTVELPTPWLEADLSKMRQDQSGDVLYIACEGYQPRKIERRDNNSWSVTLYEQTGGPFTDPKPWAEDFWMDPKNPDTAAPIMTSGTYFTDDHVNMLVSLRQAKYRVTQYLSALDAATDAIEVNGVDSADRAFNWTLSGTWAGTVSLERSVVGPDSGFIAVATDTGNGANSYDDSATFSRVTVWYRVAWTIYTSGAPLVNIDYDGGIPPRAEVRIVDINSATEAAIEITKHIQDDVGTPSWQVGDWSDELGWPSSVAFHDGRLWFGGRDKVWGSIPDDFEDFDIDVEGESGSINRSFGYGPVASVRWLCSLNRLIAGRYTSCVSIRSSNFDAPLTPIDFTMRDCTSHGSADLPPVKIDKSAVYVDKSNRRVYELRYDVEIQDYQAHDLTALNEDIGLEGFVDIAVQRQLDTRVHLVRADGKVAVLSYERGVLEAWWRVETDGEVESVCVLPGTLEDEVYYVVKRTKHNLVAGSMVATTARYLEKFARQDECVGAELNKMADSFIEYTGVPTTTITGLGHLEGREVVCWGNRKDLGTYTVSGGAITVSESVESAIVGLGYTGRFKSAKLAYAAQAGTALFQKKRAAQIGLMLIDTHYQGLEFGQDFDVMDNLPQVEEGTETPDDTIWSEFDAPMIPLPGRWQTDARLCLRATAPRPVTVAAAALDMHTYEKV